MEKGSLNLPDSGIEEVDSTTSSQPGDIAAEFTIDGKPVLIPKPSDDPNDPLNWSSTRKNITLAIICYLSFFADYGSSTGSITNLVQIK